VQNILVFSRPPDGKVNIDSSSQTKKSTVVIHVHSEVGRSTVDSIRFNAAGAAPAPAAKRILLFVVI
jgi:hypothetical protein